MELIYTCEKSEKETLELAMRPFKRYFRTVFAMAALIFVVAVECFLPELIAGGGRPQKWHGPWWTPSAHFADNCLDRLVSPPSLTSLYHGLLPQA